MFLLNEGLHLLLATGLLNSSRETKFSGANADKEILIFPCSADHVHDWQPYTVDPYSCYMCVTIHTYKKGKQFGTRYVTAVNRYFPKARLVHVSC